MKPVGLTDPKTGRWAHAVIQLRAENSYRTAYNLVGFQTKLKYGEQQRIFRKLPGLQNAEFLRLGSMHRNTYIDSPRVLLPTLQLRSDPRLFIAGQLTGTEGYLESSATGWVAGQNAVRHLRGETPLRFPVDTMLGALLHAVTDPARENFQPMNSNMGILPPLAERPRDRSARNEAMSTRAYGSLQSWLVGSSPNAST
jgi:methylenetetrahydrofolate--tRNA-(uracil-5-)-methyltransferase